MYFNTKNPTNFYFSHKNNNTQTTHYHYIHVATVQFTFHSSLKCRSFNNFTKFPYLVIKAILDRGQNFQVHFRTTTYKNHPRTNLSNKH